MVQNREAANLIAFLLIALLVMVVAGLAGRLLRGLFRGVGLGIVDRLLGAVFGLVEGCVVVTLVLMGIVAFLPRQDWLGNSRLAPVFLTAAHGGSHVVPFALGRRNPSGLASAPHGATELVETEFGNSFSSRAQTQTRRSSG